MKRDEWQKKFRKAFGKKEEAKESTGKTYQERHAERQAKMSPAEKAERQRKIDNPRSAYKDGGTVCAADKKNRLEVLAKLAKSRKKRK